MTELAAGIAKTTDPGGRDAFQLEGPVGRAVIATTGAQILSWLTETGDLLWTASFPEFRPGKPVRGGVPLVFPWFGNHPDRPDLPAHGFARNREWQLVETRKGPGIVLALTDDEQTRAAWPHAFRLELDVDASADLTIRWTVSNRGEQPFSFEQALHSYFAVGDVREASVHGLEDVPVIETATEAEDDWNRSQPLQFRAETDRVFQAVPPALRLRAPKLGRTLHLDSDNAASAIVWNPWPKKAATLSQMDVDDWSRFCCIETANVGQHAIVLQPGEQHTLRLTLKATDA